MSIRADGSDIEITRREAFLAGPQYAVHGTPGAEIVDGLAPAPNEYRIVKPRFSAFFGTKLDLILRRLGVAEVVLCGTQYPNCIRATAFDAISLGYQTFIITDATSRLPKKSGSPIYVIFATSAFDAFRSMS